jgi:hypothetical protein
MTEAQTHDYGLRPFGTHELPQELRPNADLHARLTRKSVGASDAEADELISKLPAETIRSESDELLAVRVEDYRREGDVFRASEHSIAEVEDHVGDDINRAREMLLAEQDGKQRKTLIAKLNELIDAAEVNTPPVVAKSSSDAADGVAVDGGHV